MSSKKEYKFTSYTTFRMTFIFISAFSLALLCTFLVVYYLSSASLQRNIEEELREESNEIEVMYKMGGIGGLEDMFSAESIAEGTEHVFYIFLSRDMEVLVSTDTGAFEDLLEDNPIPADMKIGEEKIYTYIDGEERRRIRVYVKKLEDGSITQIGEEMKDEQLILETIKDSFLISFVSILLIGSLLVWNIIHRTMKGVTRITETALTIGRDDLSSRVPLGNSGAEIDDLAEAFNRMLERIEVLIKEMQDITDNVAHHLRTPIARIRGTAEILYSNGSSPAPIKDKIGIIVQECDRLTAMIQVMLEIASIESTTKSRSESIFDITVVLEEIYELFSPLAESNNIKFEYVFSESPILINGNQTIIMGAVVNLVDNAIKYTPKDGDVKIKAKKAGEIVEISVSDTGDGISDKDLPHIFDKFYRGNQTKNVPGSGLGLSYVQAVAHRYEGSIQIKNTGESGTTFILSFPATINE